VIGDARVDSLRDRLAQASYGRLGYELVRFRDDANDDVVRAVVNELMVLGTPGREAFRSLLDVDGVDTLGLFSIRRTIQARRRASVYLVDEALDAYALLPALNDVPWESWLKGALFVARSLGRDLDSIARRFADAASARSDARFRVALGSMSRVTALSQCHVQEVTTNYGTGFVETIVVRDTTVLGAIYGPPPQADNVVEYRPTTNLAQLAVTLADALDATNEVLSGPVVHAELAATFFSLVVPGSHVPTTGCLSFYVDAIESDESFTAFVAELPEGADAASLVSSATSDGLACFSDDRRLILFTTPPSFDGNAEVDVDFTRFANLSRDALSDTATTRWLAQ
jgi:hypothetical protein